VPASRRWKAPWFTGCRYPSRGGGRAWTLVGPSFVRIGSLPLRADAPATTGCPLEYEEGNVVGVRQACALDSAEHHAYSDSEDTSFARSRDPCTSIVTPLFRPKAGRGDAVDSVSRSGKPGQPGGTGTGARSVGRMRGSPRVTALAREVVRDASEKEEGLGLRPCEETRAPVWLLVRRMQLQKSSGGVWSRIRSRAALPKEWRHE